MTSDDKTSTRKVLGKGLGALIPQSGSAGQTQFPAGRRWIESKPIEELEPGSCQPRKFFDDERLAELARSIKEKGVLQPLVVRKKGKGYEIIVGERRWRAAQAAGLREVPVIVTDVSDADALEMAIIENIQRQDLNPIEEAGAYERLLTEFKLTQEAVAERVGKDRSTVANMIRLLSLPDTVKGYLVSGELTVGHARSLLSLDDDAERIKLAREIAARKLTVRQVEDAVRRSRTTKRPIPLKPQATQLKSVSEDLQRRLRTKVKITDRGKRGSIVIEYYSFEELDRIVSMLLGR